MGAYQYEEQVWRRLAYACRYGHQSLGDMLHLGSYELGMLTKALSDIVREENTPKKGS